MYSKVNKASFLYSVVPSRKGRGPSFLYSTRPCRVKEERPSSLSSARWNRVERSKPPSSTRSCRVGEERSSSVSSTRFELSRKGRGCSFLHSTVPSRFCFALHGAPRYIFSFPCAQDGRAKLKDTRFCMRHGKKETRQIRESHSCDIIKQ